VLILSLDLRHRKLDDLELIVEIATPVASFPPYAASLLSLNSLNRSPFFQMLNVTPAIFRASVNRAISGRIPCLIRS
jgi:hypothetical protein